MYCSSTSCHHAQLHRPLLLSNFMEESTLVTTDTHMDMSVKITVQQRNSSQQVPGKPDPPLACMTPTVCAHNSVHA